MPHGYVTVICNHGFPAPGGIAIEMCCVFRFALSPRSVANCQGFVLYRQKWGGGDRHHGFTNLLSLSPQCGAFSRDLLNEQSNSHYYPGLVANDWCITGFK